jgi:glycosyltransferase involved in cell wall biosynthesis
MQLSIIVPVYNGEKTLCELYRRITVALGSSFSWEIIFVYDCGTDNSYLTIKSIERNDPLRVRHIANSTNIGQHRSILKGVTEARGEYIVTMDEDLQHDPVYIIRLLGTISGGQYDVVYAKFRKLKHAGMRIRLSEILRRVLLLIIPGLSPHYSPYRIINRDTALEISRFDLEYPFIDGYLAMVTQRFGFIDADHFKRAEGVSSYSYYRLLRHAILIAINYSFLSPVRYSLRKHQKTDAGN